MGDMHDHETFQIPDHDADVPPEFAVRKSERNQAIEVARNIKKAGERGFFWGHVSATVILLGLQYAFAQFGITFW